MDKNDRLIVTRLESGQHEGWLSKQVWDCNPPHLTQGLHASQTLTATQSKKMSSWDGLSPGQFLA